MQNTFFKLPVRFNTVSEGSVAEVIMCNEKESVDQYIELILTTCPGEHKFNKNFGCRIWDMDFERVVSRKKWEDDFTTHVQQAIRDFEPRLKDFTVSIHISDVVREDMSTKITAIKKRVMVYINGIIISTGEPCGFRYALYLGPLSIE